MHTLWLQASGESHVTPLVIVVLVGAILMGAGFMAVWVFGRRQRVEPPPSPEENADGRDSWHTREDYDAPRADPGRPARVAEDRRPGPPY